MLIPKHKITDIQNAADIAEIISESVLLKKAGKDYTGLCPFHSEKTPSFTVFPEKQIYYCFGCGAGGNVFNFLMKHEGCSFPEVVTRLAERYGIEITRHAASSEEERQMQERESLLSVNKTAAEFFQNILRSSDKNGKALAYINQRGITKETAEAFSLGYAPEGWQHLTNFFSAKKIPAALAEKAGLIAPNKSRTGYYDRFRDRIIFPIRDIRGQVIAFGGRVLDDSVPKYLNSPETPLFNKSRSLYGIDRARKKCRETGAVYVTEGYVDVIALHQHGFENAVATLGTALTPEHVRVLKGQAEKIILVYDSDDAGIRAAKRSVGIFREKQADAYILVLPSGYDPDSFLFHFGAEAFAKAAAKAAKKDLSLISFLTECAVKQHDPATVEGKIRIISEMKEPLLSVPEGAERSSYVQSLAERTGIDERIILEKIYEHGGPPPFSDTSLSEELRLSATMTTGNRKEQKIIAMMLQFPEVRDDIRERNTLEFFENNTLKSIGLLILSHPESASARVSDILGSAEDAEQRDSIVSLASQDNEWDDKGWRNLIEEIELDVIHRNNNMLRSQVEAAQEKNDHELAVSLYEEKLERARLEHQKIKARQARQQQLII
ncbi:MAG: DNA primase [Desulfobacteraceae bacterium IS3]|nr:MAG: DNA primase [Desulfobacteraceae bacterium IS3]